MRLRLLSDKPDAQRLATRGQVSGLLDDIWETIFKYKVRSFAILSPLLLLT